MEEIDPALVEQVRRRLAEEAEAGGYHLNPDVEWTSGLVRGLLINEGRYGYWNCPCRLASGHKEHDLDIICPCYYRDPDVHDYGACYCALYVSDEVLRGEQELQSTPERRPPERLREAIALTTAPAAAQTGHPDAKPRPSQAPSVRVWRCRVCGYLCAREHPPGICPICRARAERFEEFAFPTAAYAEREEAAPSIAPPDNEPAA